MNGFPCVNSFIAFLSYWRGRQQRRGSGWRLQLAAPVDGCG